MRPMRSTLPAHAWIAALCAAMLLGALPDPAARRRQSQAFDVCVKLCPPP